MLAKLSVAQGWFTSAPLHLLSLGWRIPPIAFADKVNTSTASWARGRSQRHIIRLKFPFVADFLDQIERAISAKTAEDRRTYLLYAVAGESGIAIPEIWPDEGRRA
jgi:hypothetical protein